MDEDQPRPPSRQDTGEEHGEVAAVDTGPSSAAADVSTEDFVPYAEDSLTDAGESGAVGRRRAKTPWLMTLFLLCLLVPSDLQFSVGPVALQAYRIYLLLVAPLLVVKYLSPRVPKAPVCDIAMLLSPFWMTVTMLSRYDAPSVIEPAGVLALETVVAYFVARVSFTSRAEVGAFFGLLVKIIMVLGPIGLVGAVLHRDPVDSVVRPLLGLPVINYDERLGMQRMSLMFMHPIHWGIFASAGVGTALMTRQLLPRVIRTACVGMGVVSCLSSGGLMAMMIQLILYVWYRVTPGFRSRWWVLLGLMTVVYFGIEFASNRSALKVALSYLTLSPGTAHWRLLIWEHGMNNVYMNPVFGLGFEDWVRPRWMFSGSMDTFWLVMTVRHGVPYFVLFSFPTAWALYAGFRMLGQARRPDPVVFAYVIFLLSLVLAAATVHYWATLLCFYSLFSGMGPCCLRSAPGDKN